MRIKPLAALLIITLTVSFYAALSVRAAVEAPSPLWSITYDRNPTYTIDGYPVSQWGDTGQAVIQTSNGGYVIVASLDDHYFVSHSGGHDNRTVEIIKTDSSGQVQWQKNIPDLQYAQSIVQTNDGGYTFCGSYVWNSSLLRFDSNGNLQWRKNLDVINARLTQTSNGGYILAGSIFRENGNLAGIIKTNADGNIEWNQTFTGDTPYAGAYAYSAIERTDGTFAVAGQKNYGTAWFAVLDSDGNLKTEKTQSGYYLSMMIPVSGDAYVTVGSVTENNAGAPISLGQIQKTDAEGNVAWTKTFNDPSNHDSQYFSFRSVIQSSDGGFIVAADTALFKLDSNGDLQWYMTSASDVTNQLGSMTAVADSGSGAFVVTGGKGDSVWLGKISLPSWAIYK